MQRDVRQSFPSDEAAGAATIEILEEAADERSTSGNRSRAADTDRDAGAPEGVSARHPAPAPAISLEELVSAMPAPAAEARPIVAPTQKSAFAPGLRTARVVAVAGRRATVAMRGAHEPVTATIAPEVEVDLIAEAAANRESVLVEVAEDGEVTVVGLVQTRRPRELHVKGDKIVVEGEREVLLRAGRAALRLREDGDVELVGSRISAASRGLFRIVGRILRLN